MNKKWEYYEPNEEKIKEISEKNNVSELFAKILVNSSGVWTASGGKFDWGGRLPKSNGGARRSP